LARRGEKNGNAGLADGLEKVADNDLSSYKRIGQSGQMESRDGENGQFSLGVEQGGNQVGEDLADQEAGRGEDGTSQNGVFEGLPDAIEVTGSIVVADDGLHALGDTDSEHDEKDQDAVDDTERAHGKVASGTQEAAVDNDGDGAGTSVYQEGRHADGEDGQNDAPSQTVDSGPEVDGAVWLAEVEDNPCQTDDLRNEGGGGCTCHSPLEDKDEERGQDEVDDNRQHHGVHRLLGVSRRAHDVVEVEKGMGDGHAQKNDPHEVVGVGQRLFAGAEEKQDILQEKDSHRTDQEAGDETQHDDVPQHFLGGARFLGAQFQGRDGGSAEADQSADGDGQIHDREGDGHARQGEVSDAVSDEDTVYNVVQGHDDHAGDGGKGIFDEEAKDRFLLQCAYIAGSTHSCRTIGGHMKRGNPYESTIRFFASFPDGILYGGMSGYG
jgi:hypothetical protein